MALIKCPECGQKISDTTKNCIHCGFELTVKENDEKEQVEDVSIHDKKPSEFTKKKIILWIIAALGSVILVGIILFFAFGLGKYLKGSIAYSKGDYSSAVRYLSESEFTLDKNKLPQAEIALAKEYISNENWQDAYDLLKVSKLNEVKDLLPDVQYNLAQEKLEAEEWDMAIELLTGFQYRDSDMLLESATKGKGMSEKADFAFLASLEESISRRMEINANESSDLRTLVTTELAYVEKYSGEEFYDSQLKSLAQKYINGLDRQLEALDEEYKADEQLEWQKGLVDRYEVLNELYEKYNFMEENKDFVGTYVAQLDNMKDLLTARQSIFTDLITKQMQAVEWSYKNQYLSGTFKNNTKYAYTVTFECTFYGKNDTILDTRLVTIDAIKPRDSYIVTVYVANPSKTDWWNITDYSIDFD